MMKTSVLCAVLLVATPAAGLAQEGGLQGRWSATFTTGAALPAGGVFHEGGSDLSEVEGLAGTGLENLNDAGSRWSVPITGVFRFGF